MKNRLRKWMVSAAAGLLTVGVALAIQSGVVTAPTTTGQVGVAYSSTLGCGGCWSPMIFSITSGSLPPGLTLTGSTGEITGTPTTPGVYTFSIRVVDSYSPPTDPASKGVGTDAASRRITPSASGTPGATYGGGPFTITVNGVAASGVPMSPWTLALVMVGLAGLGWMRLRHVNQN
jgi:large repetitive protein